MQDIYFFLEFLGLGGSHEMDPILTQSSSQEWR